MVVSLCLDTHQAMMVTKAAMGQKKTNDMYQAITTFEQVARGSPSSLLVLFAFG